MQKIKKSFWLGPLISGVLAFIAVCQINFLASWVCYIPLFISISGVSLKNTCKKGFVFGFIFSVLCFYWMIPGAERFTGSSIMYGLAVFVLCALFFSVFFAVILYAFLLLKNKSTFGVIINSVLIAAIFTVAEAFLTLITEELPWFAAYAGNGLAANMYSIQPASVFGFHILTFIVVMVNYLFAYFIEKRSWIKLYVPFTITGLYVVSGFFLLETFESKLNSNKPFTVAILAENIAPEMKWDETSGNFLVQELLNLNRSVVPLKPDMALWSESAVPWTYKKDDDLVKTILSITAPAQVTHILGINTEYKNNIVYNSAYCILPNGEVTGRYDKQYLLSFIEKPLNGLLMPFFSSSGYSVVRDKQHAAPLNTPYGKAGVLICNEAAVPAATTNQVNDGARFLFNMSNDGWFNDTYIVRLHFYYARIRAVESRKDVAVNCNNGYSGLIKASGAIVEEERSEDPFIKIVSMQPNNIISPATAFPNLFVYCCAVYLVVMAVISFINRYKQKLKQRKN